MNSHQMVNDLENEQRGADAENVNDYVDENDLVPVHISPDEALYFNILQGGQSVDDKTGLREYGKLSTVLKVPEIRNLFVEISDLLMSGQPIPDEITQIMDTPLEGEEGGLEPIESDSDPEVQALANTGDGEDKMLVMMPQDVVQFLDFVQGGKKKDKHLGLQEFGFWNELGKGVKKLFSSNGLKSIVRVVGTLGGAMLGGPAGTAIGTALGHGLTGAGLKKSLTRGAIFGAGHWGLGKMIPSVFGSGGSLASLGSNAVSAPVYGPGGKLIAAAGQSLPSSMPAIGSSAAIGAKTATQAATPSMFEGLKDYMLPAALLGGGAFLSQKGAKQKEKEEWERYNEEKARKDKSKRAMADIMNDPLSEPVSLSSSVPSSYYKKGDRVQFDRLIKHKKYKTGGKVIGIEIKGRGTGQSDEIPKTVPENSWVWDATTVSHAGDGATNAGHKAIESFEKKIKKNLFNEHKPHIDIQIKEKPLRNVSCALSNGERVTPPHLVAAIGKGSFDSGADILRKMTKELRRHKSSNGHDLPPAAHDLMTYYKKVVRG